MDGDDGEGRDIQRGKRDGSEGRGIQRGKKEEGWDDEKCMAGPLMETVESAPHMGSGTYNVPGRGQYFPDPFPSRHAGAGQNMSSTTRQSRGRCGEE
jgi:hypothetical protein